MRDLNPHSLSKAVEIDFVRKACMCRMEDREGNGGQIMSQWEKKISDEKRTLSMSVMSY